MTKTVQARSVSQYAAIIEKIQKKYSCELWFRGHSQERYILQPNLHRNKQYKTNDVIKDVEFEILSEFRFRYRNFINVYVDASDPWEALFLMQHYRVPTRLLDWTSNPFAALFFALDTATSKHNAVVWVLEPALWNHGMLHDISDSYKQKKVFSIKDPFIEQYHPDAKVEVRRVEPLSINGTVNNSRMNAQKGKFVVFGYKKQSMESFMAAFKKWDRAPLFKIVFPKSSIEGLKKSLFEFGFTHTGVYPDLEGLALELKYKFGFE